MKRGLRFAAVLFALSLQSYPTYAQQASEITSQFTLSWTNPTTFSGASANDSPSFQYGQQSPYTAQFNLSLYPDFQNLQVSSGPEGTILVSNTPPVGNTTVVTFSNASGALGSWKAVYDTTGPLTLGMQGGLATLTFNGGGSVNSSFYQNIPYYNYVYLPGDWTAVGTGPGDHELISWASGFSMPTFTYNSSTNTTTVLSVDPNYPGDGSSANIDFVLYGKVASVPEPATWALLILGFCGIGFVAHRRRAGATALMRLA